MATFNPHLVRDLHREETVMKLDDLPDELLSERLLVCSDPHVGLRAFVAIDDTTMGPGFGGVRMRSYPTTGNAMDEAQRLARAMTLKNALAGIPYGGAKSVVMIEGRLDNRVELMRRFGQFIADLGGAYVPGVDMGTTPDDMRLLAEAGADATCTAEDPSPWTAQGVFSAIKSAARWKYGSDSLDGVKVLVQGAGSVGGSLAHLLAASGARVDVSDVDSVRASTIAREVHGRVVSPLEVLGHECDVFAPCAVARVVSHEAIPHLSCSIIAGGANDTLEDAACADALAEASILYVPDFVANSGGVRFVHARRSGLDESSTNELVNQIGSRVGELLDLAAQSSSTPLAAAHRMARQLIDARREAGDANGVPAGSSSGG